MTIKNFYDLCVMKTEVIEKELGISHNTINAGIAELESSAVNMEIVCYE